MGFTEVNELRKSGKLHEALAMALDDLRNDDSAWSRKAIFWVDNDLLKKAVAEGDSDSAQRLLAEMEEHSSHFVADEYSDKALHYARLKANHHWQEVRDAVEKSKGNARDAEQAYNTVKAFYDAGQLDSSQLQDFGWIIYRYCKQIVGWYDSSKARAALATYLKLDVERPSLLHSGILRLAIELEKNNKANFKFTRFLEMWGFDNFSDDDWRQFRTDDGKTLPSVVQNAIYKYVAELKDDKITTVPDAFVALLDKAIERMPRVPMLQYQKARLLGIVGKRDEAFAILKELPAKIKQPFLWGDIADLAPTRELSIAALCKLITEQRNENFLGDARLRLAKLLIADGRYKEALREAETFYDARRAAGWKIDDDYVAVRSAIPIDTKLIADNNALYKKQLESLEELLYTDAIEQVMVWCGFFYTNKLGKTRTRLVASDGSSLVVAPKSLSQMAHNEFNFFNVRIKDNKLLSLKPITAAEGEKRFIVQSGTIVIRTAANGRPYGKVPHVFIGEEHLKNLRDGDSVRLVGGERNGKRQAFVVMKVEKNN